MKRLWAGLFCLLVCVYVTTGADAALVGDDLQARVKGQITGNWEIALGDAPGVAGSFVQATGPDPFDGTTRYNFTLDYHASTGVSTFQVSNPSFTSSLLTTPDYGITGYGFNGITLGIRDGKNGSSLTVGGLVLNGSALAGVYSGGGTQIYSTYPLYAGSSLTDIVLTGQFVFAGDYLGLNENTKFDLNLNGAAPVPIPGALLLFGSGLLGLVGIGRKRLQK